MFCRLIRLRGDHRAVVLDDERAVLFWHEHAGITRKGHCSFASLLRLVGVFYLILPISELSYYLGRSMVVKQVLLLSAMGQHVVLRRRPVEINTVSYLE